jgi:2-polyprenyl-3-methyl-5-hydroxy-6-metoxy-1,4-benzoquinol methylase
MDFTGERFVPGSASGLLEAEHVQRYTFATNYAKGKSVLDIACGAGYGSYLLHAGGATRVIGVDISAEAIQFANDHYGSDEITFVVHDAEQFKNGSYDMITSFETLEHLDKRQQFLENTRSMLNEHGILIMSTPNKLITSPMKSPSEIRNTFHTYEYLEEEFVSALQKAGFTRIQKFGQHAYPWFFRNQIVSRLLRRHLHYDTLETAQVRPLINNAIPRYFVFIAGTGL